MIWTIAHGNPWDGVALYGLFADVEEANTVAEREFPNEDWWVVRVWGNSAALSPGIPGWIAVDPEYLQARLDEALARDDEVDIRRYTDRLREAKETP